MIMTRHKNNNFAALSFNVKNVAIVIFQSSGIFKKKKKWKIKVHKVKDLQCLTRIIFVFFLQCRICTKCFVEKSGLRAHLLTHCPINKECPQCGKLFKTERTMTRHLRTHLNLTYTCEICNKQFRHEESLRVHKSVHKEGGKFVFIPVFLRHGS